MAQVGRLEEFDVTSGDVDSYFERLDCFFIANKVKNDAKTPTFISLAGAKTYKLLKSLCAPDKPSDKTIDEVKQVLKSHIQPAESLITRRARFYARKQKEHESITDFVAALKELSAECDFGQFLNDALRDIFCIGVSDIETQKQLRTGDAPSFADAVKKALARESLMKDMSAISLTSPGECHHMGEQPGNRKPSYSREAGRKPPDVTQGGRRRLPPGCYRCGKTDHDARNCRFKTYICRQCGKTGHLKAVCRSRPGSTKHIEMGEDEEEEWEDQDDSGRQQSQQVLRLFYNDSQKETGTAPWTARVKIDGVDLEMEIDTGSAKSIIGKDTLAKLFKGKQLERKAPILTTYSGNQLNMKGTAQVKVTHNQQAYQMELLVADVTGQPPILGREWLTKLKLDWTQVFNISKARRLEEVLADHKPVFEETLGTLKGFKAKLHLKPEATPKFFKARPVPFALRKKVEESLDELEQEGVLTKVTHSDWGSPIVVVPKKTGDVRICGDYKVTLNQVLDVDQHPLPKPDDLFATLAGGKVFSKLDLSQAYHQMEVDEESQHLLTITTHKGLYQYRRLPFGISSAPALFQRTIEQILQGIPGVAVFIDDIEISGATVGENLERLDQVLQRLEDRGLRVNKSKCEFLKDKVEYLGHIIDKDGLHPVPEKVQAITEAATPSSVSELRSYLGVLQYYARFLPNLSSELAPLHELLKDGAPWKWTDECQKTFMRTKELLTSADVLTHFDINLPIRLECDASPVGLGAVISHEMPDGSHRPIAYASRTLSKSERNYAQIEKEALALVFGVKKFHDYLYGRPFTLVTDHKPLLTILGPKNGVPTLAAARMQRWALILAAYQYNLLFRSTKEHQNADMLSRLPLETKDSTGQEEQIFTINCTEDLPVTAKQIAETTRKDPILSRVWSYTLNGWPNHIKEAALQPYWKRHLELSVEEGVVLWGLRVIVPPSLRQRILGELHEEHPGMCRMKALARSYVWWPGIDQDIESTVRACSDCSKVANTPPTAPLHPWSWPQRPWQRVHIDFAEHQGQHYFVLIDAHSKWPEVVPMRNTTTEKTIEILRNQFASHGLPEEVVSDNGPQFTAQAFDDFLRQNGVKHTNAPPYHPATNGAVERFVQVLKKSLKRSSQLTIQHQVANLLFRYRATPHSTTGVSPAELFLKRQLRVQLALVKPDQGEAIRRKQKQQKKHHDHGTKFLRTFVPGDTVAVRQFRGPQKWISGTVMQRLGPTSYMVHAGGRIIHVHIDHLISAPQEKEDEREETVNPLPAGLHTPDLVHHPDPGSAPDPPNVPYDPISPTPPCHEPGAVTSGEMSPKSRKQPSLPQPETPMRRQGKSPSPLRKSIRERRAPHHLDL